MCEMSKDEKSRYIRDEFCKVGLVLSDTQCEQFLRYYELLVEWNEKINLTAITDFDQVVLKHFIDSAALLTLKDIPTDSIKGKLIDVGTGAGFPGIPLKILNPSLKVTLLDSLNKRMRFLETVCAELNLKEIKLLCARAEDAAHEVQYREKYDVCIARAVANLATLSEYCLPFIHTAGYFLAYKSGDIRDEVNEAKKAIKVMGGDLKKVGSFTLGGSDIARSMVVIRKVTNTPKKYPRKAGTPGKQPIK